MLEDLIEHVRYMTNNDETAMAHITNAVNSYMRHEGMANPPHVAEPLPAYKDRWDFTAPVDTEDEVVH